LPLLPARLDGCRIGKVSVPLEIVAQWKSPSCNAGDPDRLHPGNRLAAQTNLGRAPVA
jgi:hypothetical protein